MKNFFKNVLSTIVGVLISFFLVGVIVSVIFAGIVSLALSSSPKSYSVSENSVLDITLSGIMKDRVSSNPLLDYLDISEANVISMTDVLQAIKKAKTDNNIKGIYINSGVFSASTASLQEIRAQLEDFKTSGKFIVSYASVYTQGGYFLSSIADKVILNPQGSVDLSGLSVSPTFYKGLLDKLGVEMQIFKVGTYKSAIEPYIKDKMSDPNREQVAAFVSDIWSTVLGKISSSRGISVEKLNELTDALPALQDPVFFTQNKMVDTLMYETDAKEYIKSMIGVGADDSLNSVSVAEMVLVPTVSDSKSLDEIAVLYAEGSIMSGTSNTDINDQFVIKQLNKLKDDDDVKAVVFRVNSPGGSAYASEQIWKAVSDLKAKKPIVVSMGNYAASGGYYISCNASRIYAQPTTLTGSIGIFGMFPNAQGLTNKIGLSFDNVKTNKFSDFGDVTRPLRPEEKDLLQQYVNRGYDLFITRCAEGRNIPKEELAKIAEGRVWTGSQALGLRLVDELGGISDAVTGAARLAKTESYSVREYPKPTGPFDMLLNTMKNDVASELLKSYLGADYEMLKTVKTFKEMKEQDFIQARMAYEVK